MWNRKKNKLFLPIILKIVFIYPEHITYNTKAHFYVLYMYSPPSHTSQFINTVWVIYHWNSDTVYLEIIFRHNIRSVSRQMLVVQAFKPSTPGSRGWQFWVQGQYGLQSQFQDIHGYTEKPVSKKAKTNNKKEIFPQFCFLLFKCQSQVVNFPTNSRFLPNLGTNCKIPQPLPPAK